MKIIDISQEIYQGMPVYPGDPTFQSHRVNSFKQGDMCEVSEVTMGTHCGTHIDAPTVENMELCDGEVHAALLKAGIPLLEGLRLEEADKENYELSALPIRLMGENGAPCRAVLIEKE